MKFGNVARIFLYREVDTYCFRSSSINLNDPEHTETCKTNEAEGRKLEKTSSLGVCSRIRTLIHYSYFHQTTRMYTK